MFFIFLLFFQNCTLNRITLTKIDISHNLSEYLFYTYKRRKILLTVKKFRSNYTKNGAFKKIFYTKSDWNCFCTRKKKLLIQSINASEGETYGPFSVNGKILDKPLTLVIIYPTEYLIFLVPTTFNISN